MNADKPARRPRGELEALVLRVLWEHDGPLTAKEIQGAIPGSQPAHTTVLTALDRLSAKGQVRRVGEEQRGVRFTTTRSEGEHVGLAMLERLGNAQHRGSALQHFAGHLDADDIAALRRALGDDVGS